MEPKYITKDLEVDDYCPYFVAYGESPCCAENQDYRPKGWRDLCNIFPYCKARTRVHLSYWEPYPKDYVFKMRVIKD